MLTICGPHGIAQWPKDTSKIDKNYQMLYEEEVSFVIKSMPV